MYRYAELPFPRGKTLATDNPQIAATLSATSGEQYVGQTFAQPDKVHQTGRHLVLRVVRNESGGALTIAALTDRFVAYRATTAEDLGAIITGITGTLSMPGRPVDDFYAESTNLVTIAEHDLFYVVDEGPVFATTAAADCNLAIQDPLTNDALGAINKVKAGGGDIKHAVLLSVATTTEDQQVLIEMLPYRSTVDDEAWTAAAFVQGSTDNSTGSDAGDTIAAITEAATITDSSGGSDPGDDIIAAVTNLDTLTDSTGGAVDNTVAADVGKVVLAFPLALADVSGAGDIVTDYIPGFAGTIDTVNFVAGTPVATGSKNMDIVVDIGAVEVTGGLIDLDVDSTTLGQVIAGSAVAGTNVFTNVETISVRAEDVVQFSEGTGTVFITCTVTGVNDNFKELTDQVITQKAANTAILAAVAQLAAKVNVNSLAVDSAADAVAQITTKQTEIIDNLIAGGQMDSS